MPNPSRRRNEEAARVGKRYDVGERNQRLEAFEAARSRGESVAVASAVAGASPATIRRWTLEKGSARVFLPATPSQAITIEQAVARIADMSTTDRDTFLIALFKLIAWLRWPREPDLHPAAIALCVCGYAASKHKGKTLSELPPDDLRLFLGNVHIELIRKTLTIEHFELPFFELPGLHEQPYTRLDVLAGVVWFVNAYLPTQHTRYSKPSIEKARLALHQRLMTYEWTVSQKTFKKLWLEQGSAAPFYYVERFHSNLDLTLNPSEADFNVAVDDLVKRRHELVEHLGRARYVMEQFVKRLDPRATAAQQFPRLDSVKAQPVEYPSLPAKIQAMRTDGQSGFNAWSD